MQRQKLQRWGSGGWERNKVCFMKIDFIQFYRTVL